MSDFPLTYRTNFEECSNSEWFKNELQLLSMITSFPFAISSASRQIFSNGEINHKIKQKISFRNDLFLTCEFPSEVETKTPNLYTNFCLLLKNSLEQQLQSSNEMDSLSSEIVDKYEELNILYDFSQMLGTLSTPGKIFDTILEKVELALNVDRASIMLYDEKLQIMEIVATHGYDINQIENPKISLEKSISGFVLKNGEALLVDNMRNLPREIEVKKSKEYKSESFITVPMIFSPIQVNTSKIGVINVTEKRDRKVFSSGDLKLLNSIASLAAIAIYNNRLLEKVLEAERLNRDLQIAENIQLGLLPTEFPEFSDLDIYGRCSSAKNVGGDYFDYFLDGDEWLDLLIADVSGHNISAALMMANTRSVLKSLMNESTPVNEILKRANHLLFDDMNRSGFFISVFLMRYNRMTRQLKYANGGHHPVFLYQSQKNKFIKLDADGLLLGVMPDFKFDEKTYQLSPGDILIMYTDGLIEARNAKDEFFGYDKLKQLIVKTANLNAKGIVNEIFSKVHSFAKSVSQADDITLQVLKVKE